MAPRAASGDLGGCDLSKASRAATFRPSPGPEVEPRADSLGRRRRGAPALPRRLDRDARAQVHPKSWMLSLVVKHISQSPPLWIGKRPRHGYRRRKIFFPPNPHPPVPKYQCCRQTARRIEEGSIEGRLRISTLTFGRGWRRAFGWGGCFHLEGRGRRRAFGLGEGRIFYVYRRLCGFCC